MIPSSKRLEGIHEYYFSKKLREIDELNKNGKAVLNLGIGSPDLPPHPDVIKTLQDETAKPHTHAYQSYRGVSQFREAIANWYLAHYEVTLQPQTEILPLMGSKEGIMHICMSFLNPGDAALVPDPGYPTYAAAAKLAGANLINYTVDENGFEALLATKNTGNIKLAFINIPHMPSGITISLQQLEALVQWASREKILLVHDNPYSFILTEKPQSILQIAGAMDCSLELNSLSKSHNMAGWRVGAVLGKESFINEILRFKSNMDSGMFLPLQLAAAKALSLPADWYLQLNEVYRTRRNRVFEILQQVGCYYSDDQAGLFVWARIPGAFEDGFQFSDHLLAKYRVFITPGGVFGKNGQQFVRVSLCSQESKFEEALKRIRA